MHPFLFKLYSYFQYVNSRAEIPARAAISPCMQSSLKQNTFNNLGCEDPELHYPQIRVYLYLYADNAWWPSIRPMSLNYYRYVGVGSIHLKSG